ncbi:MAG: serine hydrolase [Acidobacteria bacterium]|nr:serine hydrolase [Acidobacteriota bacterium]
MKSPFWRALLLLVVSLTSWLARHAAAEPLQGLTRAAPETIGLLSARLKLIDRAVEDAIRAGEIPGAVVLVARRGRIGYRKALGSRALDPQREAMTEDTIFDVASLTKVLATAPAIMLLVEDARLRLDDRVKRYLPKFTGGGKDSVTVRQLLTHYSGLRPDFDLSKPWSGYEAALEELWNETTQSEPGKEFAYSDLNFIALGEIVRTVSGKPLDVFARERIYSGLGMSRTSFRPPAEWLPRIAPTESRARSLQYLKGHDSSAGAQEILRGEVHDPTAWRMGGVAGHAGLFSCARDIAIYAQMLLNHGTYGSRRIFAPLTVEAMTTPRSPRGALPLRGLGWDIDTGYSSPRGDLLEGGYGHTGFTGTSLWIYPAGEAFIIVLSNRVHPEGKGDATHLRGVVANIVATAIADAQ